MEWLFSKRALPLPMRGGYAARLSRGGITLGMSWGDVAFVNLAAIRSFRLLIRIIEHEALHIACGTGREDVIDALQRR